MDGIPGAAYIPSVVSVVAQQPNSSGADSAQQLSAPLRDRSDGSRRTSLVGRDGQELYSHRTESDYVGRVRAPDVVGPRPVVWPHRGCPRLAASLDVGEPSVGGPFGDLAAAVLNPAGREVENHPGARSTRTLVGGGAAGGLQVDASCGRVGVSRPDVVSRGVTEDDVVLETRREPRRHSRVARLPRGGGFLLGLLMVLPAFPEPRQSVFEIAGRHGEPDTAWLGSSGCSGAVASCCEMHRSDGSDNAV